MVSIQAKRTAFLTKLMENILLEFYWYSVMYANAYIV